MKYIIALLFLTGCNQSQPGGLEEITATFSDKKHGVVCYTWGDDLSCVQLKE